MTHSSAAIATSCRCAQATSRHHSRSYEQTYSHQFEHRQMIDLMQNDGEFEGTAIANELVHTCLPARARPMDCSRLCVQRRQSLSYKHAVPRFTPRYEFKALKKNSKIAHSYAFENRRAALCVSAPTKKRPYPLPPRPRIRGASPKYFPLFRQKEFYEVCTFKINHMRRLN